MSKLIAGGLGIVAGVAAGFAAGRATGPESMTPQEALNGMPTAEAFNTLRDQTEEDCAKVVVGESMVIDFSSVEGLEGSVGDLKDEYNECVNEAYVKPATKAIEQIDGLKLEVTVTAGDQ